jgi:taurine dioxygenase
MVLLQPSGAPLGARVDGVDLRRVDDETFAAIYRAWLAHQVLLFPAQRLTDGELIAFSNRFGDLDLAPIQETGRRFVEGHPELYVVSNVIENGVPIGSLGAGEAVWHTDMSYQPIPPKASVLYALEVPPRGGNTSFCSMYDAWERLSAELQRRIRGASVKHDGTYNSGGYLREGLVASDDPRTSEGMIHPLVCRHPETGRPHLYLGRRRLAWVQGLSLDESEALLDELWHVASEPSRAWTHEWNPGDLVLWDNRCTMHRRDAFDASTRRILHRTQVKSTQRPVAFTECDASHPAPR